MNEKRYYRDDIAERRSNYMVKYGSASHFSYFAYVSLTYIRDIPQEQVLKDMEKEFKIWFKRFPLPTFIASFDSTGSSIDLESKEFGLFYFGYPTLNGKYILKWTKSVDDEVPNIFKTEEYRENVYSKIKYITQEQINEKVAKEGKKFKIGLNIFRVFWTIIAVAIPLAWCLGGVLFLCISYVATLLVFVKAISKFLQIWGLRKEYSWEKYDREKELKEKHFIHHCKKNPEGFQRLVCGNFTKELKEKVRNEYAKLPNKKIKKR